MVWHRKKSIVNGVWIFPVTRSTDEANCLDQGIKLGQQLSHPKLADDGKIACSNINYIFYIFYHEIMIRDSNYTSKNTKLMAKLIFGQLTIDLSRYFGINETKFQDKIQK